jgi:hypothetical protein
MRFRLRPLTVLVFSIPTALMGVLAACGGDSTTTDGGSDATVDVAKDVTPDVQAETGPVDAGCDAPDLSVLLPDGSLDASAIDAGGFNAGCLYNCMEAPADAGGCGTALQGCNVDCWCRQGVIDFGTCIAQTQDLQTCGLAALSTNNQNLTTLLLCAQQKCLATCSGGGDAGTSDAASDATTD